MHGYVTSGRRPISEPIDGVLGRELSPRARRFAEEYADFLVRVDFGDIADHPLEYVRSAEAHCSSDGVRHSIWLDKESPDFEGLMMHQVMRGVLMEKGYPRTASQPTASFEPHLLYLSSLLSSAVTDPIIDMLLMEDGYGVYDRELLIHRTMEQVWLDARAGVPKKFGLLFCKWALLTVLFKLDLTYEGANVGVLHALIRKKFPESWQLGDELARSVKKKGFKERHPALLAILDIRSALKLEHRILVIDAEGIRL